MPLTLRFRVEVGERFAPRWARPNGGKGSSASPNPLERSSGPTGLVPVGESDPQGRKLRNLWLQTGQAASGSPVMSFIDRL